MSSKVKVGFGVLLFMSLAVFLSAKSISDSNVYPTCYPTKEARQLSPDKKYELSLANQFCAGVIGDNSDSFWITVYDLTRLNDQGVRVFVASDSAPAVSWIDSNNILVTILQLCQVNKSLREAGVIKITYRLADELLEENFAKRMDKYERARMRDGSTFDKKTPQHSREPLHLHGVGTGNLRSGLLIMQ